MFHVICNVRRLSSLLVTTCINIDLMPENQLPVCNPAGDITALLKYELKTPKLTRLFSVFGLGLAVLLINNPISAILLFF